MAGADDDSRLARQLAAEEAQAAAAFLSKGPSTGGPFLGLSPPDTPDGAAAAAALAAQARAVELAALRRDQEDADRHSAEELQAELDAEADAEAREGGQRSDTSSESDGGLDGDEEEMLPEEEDAGYDSSSDEDDESELDEPEDQLHVPMTRHARVHIPTEEELDEAMAAQEGISPDEIVSPPSSEAAAADAADVDFDPKQPDAHPPEREIPVVFDSEDEAAQAQEPGGRVKRHADSSAPGAARKRKATHTRRSATE